MPKAGVISLFGTSAEFRILADWLRTRSPRDASWLVSQESIEVQNGQLALLQEQLEKAGRSQRGRRYIKIPRDAAAAFVSVAMPCYPSWGVTQPRAVRQLYRRAKHRLSRKPGPEKRGEPRVPTPDEGSVFRTGRQKEYRRRKRVRKELRALADSGVTVLGGAAKKVP